MHSTPSGAGQLGRESNSESTPVSRGHGLSVASGPLWPLWSMFCSAWQRANDTPRLCLRRSAWTTTACIPQLQSHMRCYAKTPRVGLTYSLELTGDCIDYQQTILLFPSIPQDHTAPRPPPTALCQSRSPPIRSFAKLIFCHRRATSGRTPAACRRNQACGVFAGPGRYEKNIRTFACSGALCCDADLPPRRRPSAASTPTPTSPRRPRR